MEKSCRRIRKISKDIKVVRGKDCRLYFFRDGKRIKAPKNIDKYLTTKTLKSAKNVKKVMKKKKPVQTPQTRKPKTRILKQRKPLSTTTTKPKPKPQEKIWDVENWKASSNPDIELQSLVSLYKTGETVQLDLPQDIKADIVPFKYKGLKGNFHIGMWNDLIFLHYTKCLYLVLGKYKNRWRGYISELKGSSCAKYIDKLATGTKLVQFALALFCKLGVNEIVLTDASRVTCEKKQDDMWNPSFALWLFYMLAHGTTWYEKFGFKPLETDYNVWKTKINTARSTKIKELNLDKSTQLQIDKFTTNPEETLGGLFSKLGKDSKTNCSVISQILDGIPSDVKHPLWALIVDNRMVFRCS
jgi:hypothetical protein